MKEFLPQKNIINFYGAPTVVHCHHYNTILQRTFSDALGESFNSVLVEAAMNSTRNMIEGDDFPKENLILEASKMFAILGHGTIDFSEIENGAGQVKLPSSHFAIAWYEKFGPATTPVCHFAAGYALAVINAAFNVEYNSPHIEEIACRAIDPEGNDSCIFEVRV